MRESEFVWRVTDRLALIDRYFDNDASNGEMAEDFSFGNFVFYTA